MEEQNPEFRGCSTDGLKEAVVQEKARAHDRKIITMLRGAKNRIMRSLAWFGFLAALGAYSYGLEVMGYSLPFFAGAALVLIGILGASLFPYYAPFANNWPKRRKHASSLVLLAFFVMLTTLSVIQTPLTLRPVIGQLQNVGNHEYRQLVAETIDAFNPTDVIRIGGTMPSRDGARQVDITVHSVVDGRAVLTLIEVVDIESNDPATIERIDVAVSKKTDLNADFGFIFSNTGFDGAAIRKAKRANIGLMSVLRSGDDRIKAIIEEEIYISLIDYVGPQTAYLELIDAKSQELIGPDGPETLTYKNRSVIDWLHYRAGIIALANPFMKKRLLATYRFKEPTTLDMNGVPVQFKSIAIEFEPNVQWFAQTVRLDASDGVYDYIRGKVNLSPGSSYTLQGIDHELATPLSVPPDGVIDLDVGLTPSGDDFVTKLANRMDSLHGGPFPELEELILPESMGIIIER